MDYKRFLNSDAKDIIKDWSDTVLEYVISKYLEGAALGSDWGTGIGEIESPIEQLMYIELCEIERTLFFRFYKNESQYCQFCLNSQYPIEINRKQYKADFLMDCDIEGQRLKVVIECDGHDYHERTKEQARRDRKRDRDMLQTGYYVLRFTGSEIYKNAGDCAREVNVFIAEKVEEILRR